MKKPPTYAQRLDDAILWWLFHRPGDEHKWHKTRRFWNAEIANRAGYFVASKAARRSLDRLHLAGFIQREDKNPGYRWKVRQP